MFIDRAAYPLRRRSQERNGDLLLMLWLIFAPANGADTGVVVRSINIALLTE